MNSGRPGRALGLRARCSTSGSRARGGAQAGNACFWFEVRSGGSVIGTHGSYASAAGLQHRDDADDHLDRASRR